MKRRWVRYAVVAMAIMATVWIGVATVAPYVRHGMDPQAEQMIGQAPGEAGITPAQQQHDIDELRSKGAVTDELLVRGLPDGAGAALTNEYGMTSGQATLTKLSVSSLDEKVVRSATLELTVKKGAFNERYERAVAIAREAGGFVGQSKSTATGRAIASGDLVMRIPAERFEVVLSDLKRLGTVKALDISSEDVSEEFVDLSSRLKHWRAQEAILLDLMRRAKTISESITVQNNLSQVQMEIERISGRLNFIENRTSYATVRLSMAEPQVTPEKDRWGIKKAAAGGIAAGAQTVGALLMIGGYLLPLAALAAIGYGAHRIGATVRKRPARADL